MSTISITKLYTLLLPKLGHETSENLTTFIEEKIKSEMENNTSLLATKADLYAAREDIAGLKKEIAESKSDVIKWTFIFWMGQAAVTLGSILLFLKK